MEEAVINVLLVENNPGDEKLIREILKHSPDIRISDHVSTLSEALKNLENSKPDLVLLDLSLPDSQGMETVEKVSGRFPDIPLIILTGHTDEEYVHHALSQGAQDYFIKGEFLTSDLLTRAIKYSIERQAARKVQESLNTQLLHSQKMEALGLLAGGVAHDFNNLLTVIMGYTSIALSIIPEDHEVTTYLNTINCSAEKAANLTRQLLLFSRKHGIEKKITDVNLLIKELVKMLKRLVGENVSIEFNLSENLMKAEIDPGQIEQAIMNLVINARDAMQPKGGRIVISTENFLEPDHEGKDGSAYICLSVSDEGPGIERSIAEKIFEPFFTTKSETCGTGLGLSVVHGIVKQHEGTITLNSSPGNGAEFVIRLPACRDVPEVAVETGGERNRIDDLKGLRVLLVEDEEVVRDFVTSMLEAWGIFVTAVSDVETAAEEMYTKDKGFHVVISDVVLPDGNGHDLARRIMNDFPHIRVLLMSGYIRIKEMFDASTLAEENIAFIQKPFSIVRFQQVLLDIL